jgi:NAD(P)-dependent dehydrogenase (short-subunit alcohol dehydrogenase family)
VTGAGRGIGKAIALKLANEGANVAIVDLNGEDAANTAEEVREAGREALSFPMDVCDPAATVHVVETLQSTWEQIDILVNNAGIAIAKPALEFEETEWRHMFDVNFHSVVRFCKLCGVRMREAGSGKIINIASEAAKTVRPLMSLYGATKLAVIGFTRGLAQELAPYQINVNAVCPGIVQTPMWDGLDAAMAQHRGLKPGEALESRRQTIPLGRLSVPEDVANVVAFLASDDAAYMTGQAINVTGGREQH